MTTFNRPEIFETIVNAYDNAADAENCEDAWAHLTEDAVNIGEAPSLSGGHRDYTESEWFEDLTFQQLRDLGRIRAALSQEECYMLVCGLDARLELGYTPDAAMVEMIREGLEAIDNVYHG